jgi:prolyl-tRNA editing enzyme YbaK/EbsC (Cys-tRNA(Pro) deacylase)
MLTSQDLQRFINQQQITAEILPMSKDTPTVPDAARALEVKEEQIIKSLVFLVAEYPTGDGRPVLVIANGTGRVDDRLVARHFGVGRKKVKMASPEQALEITGYAVGAMPPFGHQSPLLTLVDPGVVDQEKIFGGGGEINAMLRLTPEELLRVIGAEIVSVS